MLYLENELMKTAKGQPDVAFI